VPLRSKMLALSTIPVVVVIFAVVYAVSAHRTAARTNAQVDRTNTVRQLLVEIQDDLALAESSVRGYLLTGRTGIQDDYDEALSRLRRDLSELDARLGEKLQRKRLERLRELVDDAKVVGALRVVVGLDAAIVSLMVFKPGAVGSVTVAGAGLALGSTLAVIASRRSRQPVRSRVAT
jgi:CHASE3 domain sensor protein